MKIKNKYEKLEKIGQGSFGKVFKVRNRSTKEFMVMKEIDLSTMNLKMKKDAENEVKLLKSFNNPFILKFIESFKSNSKFVINS